MKFTRGELFFVLVVIIATCVASMFHELDQREEIRRNECKAKGGIMVAENGNRSQLICIITQARGNNGRSDTQ